MKNNLILVFVIVLLGSCQNPQDVEFMVFVKSLEENEKITSSTEVLKAEPFYENNIIELLQTKKNNFPLNHYRRLAEELSNFNPSHLNEKNQIVKKSLNSFLQNKIQVLQKGESGNAEIFSILSLLKQDVEDEVLTNEEQFEKIIQHLEQVPRYFEEAKFIIKKPDEEKLRIAIDAFSKDYFYLKNDLPTLIRKPDILKEDQIDFSNKNEMAQIAIKDFAAFLNSHWFEMQENLMKSE